jgi:hypothetical protein
MRFHQKDCQLTVGIKVSDLRSQITNTRLCIYAIELTIAISQFHPDRPGLGHESTDEYTTSALRPRAPHNTVATALLPHGEAKSNRYHPFLVTRARQRQSIR